MDVYLLETEGDQSREAHGLLRGDPENELWN